MDVMELRRRILQAVGEKNLINKIDIFNRYISTAYWSWSNANDSASVTAKVEPNTTYIISGYPSDCTIYRLATISREELPSVDSPEPNDITIYDIVRKTNYADFGATRTFTTNNSATYAIFQTNKNRTEETLRTLKLVKVV